MKSQQNQCVKKKNHSIQSTSIIPKLFLYKNSSTIEIKAYLYFYNTFENINDNIFDFKRNRGK